MKKNENQLIVILEILAYITEIRTANNSDKKKRSYTETDSY